MKKKRFKKIVKHTEAIIDQYKKHIKDDEELDQDDIEELTDTIKSIIYQIEEGRDSNKLTKMIGGQEGPKEEDTQQITTIHSLAKCHISAAKWILTNVKPTYRDTAHFMREHLFEPHAVLECKKKPTVNVEVFIERYKEEHSSAYFRFSQNLINKLFTA